MTGRIADRLAELNVSLPDAPGVEGAYVPFVLSANLLFVSGQLPFDGGNLAFRGRLGDTLSVDDGYHAARLCGINILAQVQRFCSGDLDRVHRMVRLGGFVNCTADFTDQPKVINGASDLMLAVFGESGRHARAAVGAPSLPLGAAVEVEAVVDIGG